MVIKSERGIYGYFVIIFLIIIFLVLLYVDKGASLLFSILYQTPIIIISLLYYIEIGRTLYFDEKGCTVSFLWYKKTIPWGRLKYIQIESYQGRITYRSPYDKAILFSTRKIHKHKWLKPTVYGIFFPTSFFYIYFFPDVPLETDALHPKYPLEFCCDEKEFMDKLKEWNVHMMIKDLAAHG